MAERNPKHSPDKKFSLEENTDQFFGAGFSDFDKLPKNKVKRKR